MNGFWFGVLTSFVGTLVFELLRRTASFSFYPYPDIRGKWEGEYINQGETGRELVHVKQQFWRWCKGTFTSTNPNDERNAIKYKFVGKFIYTNTVQGRFRSTTRQCLDDGVFLIRVDHNTRAGSGGSVSIDQKTNEPIVHTYEIKRLPRY